MSREEPLCNIFPDYACVCDMCNFKDGCELERIHKEQIKYIEVEE